MVDTENSSAMAAVEHRGITGALLLRDDGSIGAYLRVHTKCGIYEIHVVNAKSISHAQTLWENQVNKFFNDAPTAAKEVASR